MGLGGVGVGPGCGGSGPGPGGDGTGEFTDLARIPFAARALAYDGARFWTNHREANEIVAFET